MINTEVVEIKITQSNFDYYYNLGYYDIKLKDSLIIPTALLQKGSQIEIECECDGCGSKKNVLYKNYIKYLKDERWGLYLCRKCSEPKRKKTLMENYGVEYPYQNKEIRYKNR